MSQLLESVSISPGNPLIQQDLSSARCGLFELADGMHYDVAVIGAGISGSRIFHQLCEQGYRVLLIDKGDFACGTSQASGMMIWGGLLYLKDLDFITVAKLCRARDEWIARVPHQVRTASLIYLQGRKGLRNRHLVHAGMMLYWLMGSLGRRFPKRLLEFQDASFLKPGRFRGGLAFEEAVLHDSDSRFVLDWIMPHAGQQTMALNHCTVGELKFHENERRWNFDLHDCLQGHQAAASARFIVNAAGVWTDRVNETLAVESPYRHEMSKGVYISIRRPEALDKILIFDTGKDADTFTVSPWGPVALCGPTEARVTSLHAGFQPTHDEIRSLLQMSNENLNVCLRPEDIVSLRCGVRPLAVRRDFNKIVHPLELSRRHLIHHDRSRNVVSVYGGKLTSCSLMADQVSALLSPHLRVKDHSNPHRLPPREMEKFPGLEHPVPAATWCRDYESCLTLDDYLRRRTNIAQWIPRRGLGANSENTQAIRRIARVFSADAASAETALMNYQASVSECYDRILRAV